MEHKPYSKIENGLKRLEGKEYISDSTIDFFRDIVRAQYKVKDQLKGEENTSSLTEEMAKDKLQKGIPLVSWKDIPFKESSLKALFEEICEIMRKQEGSEDAAIERLVNAEGDGTLELTTLTRKLFIQDNLCFQSLSRTLNVGEDLLVYIALQLAKPFVEVVAENLREKVVDDLWLRHCCPVCGSSAQIARLEKEVGKKILCCLLCGSEWRFMRVKCPFCCNEEQKTLKFIEEEKGPYRIDICERCKRYIKTLDERKGGGDRGEAISSIEDLATMYLDIVAEKEGYVRSWFFPPSVDQLRGDGESKTIH